MNQQDNSKNVILHPHMEEAGILLLEQHLKIANVFLEYGVGGSTFFAAKLNVPYIYSVESDKNFLELIQQRITSLYPATKASFFYINIGKTKEWGYPVDKELASNWPNYCTAPWHKIIENNQFPDVILIDGRFRVACFLISLLLAKAGTVILFDDYVDRPHYHIVEKHLKPSNTVGRMAEFIVKSNLLNSLVVLDLIKYCTITD